MAQGPNSSDACREGMHARWWRYRTDGGLYDGQRHHVVELMCICLIFVSVHCGFGVSSGACIRVSRCSV